MSKTVLLIDDSKFVRRSNELVISKAGYNVVGASDGEEGLEVARNKLPDVIVLDMMLPKLSGPQLLQALKQDPRTSQIPIIVLSSLPQSNEAKLKKEGAAFYLEKSVDGDAGAAALVQAIGAALSSTGTARLRVAP
jgi:twitching motility two-component system response regulator PilH